MKCTICGEQIYLQCSDDEPKTISNKPVCSDCYYNELGKVIEKHPIGYQFYKKP